MATYFIVYRVPVETMEEWRKNTKPEEMKAQSEKMGAEMMEWMKAHDASFVDRGQPLGKTKRVTKSGVTDERNDLNYYQIVEASSHEEAVKIFADSPHVRMIPTAYIDVMEIPHRGL